MTPEDRPVDRRPAPAGRSRTQLAILAAIALGTLVVVAVLATTLVSGEGDEGAVPTTRSPQPTVPIDELLGTAPIPEGDYEAFCAEVAAASAELAVDGDELAVMRQALQSYDIDQLIVVSPTGLQPALTTLRDQRATVLEVLEQIDDTAELSQADLPADFLDAFGLVARTATQECTPSG